MGTDIPWATKRRWPTMNELAADHPQNHPAVLALREADCVSGVQWCYDTTYKITFRLSASAEQREAVLDRLEAECGFTPTDDQLRGRDILISKETVEIEVNSDE
jgi:hypothetical protein